MVQYTGNVSEGVIVELIGPIVEVEFEESEPPKLNDVLVVEGVTSKGQQIRVLCKVQQIIDERRVRSVATSRIDGLAKGMKVINTGEQMNEQIYMPAPHNDKVGNFLILFFGLIVTIIGFSVMYFAGQEETFTCHRSYDMCTMEKRKIFYEVKEKEYEIELSSIENAVLEYEYSNSKVHDNTHTNGSIIYKISLVTKDGKMPLSMASTNEHSLHSDRVKMINDYLDSDDEELKIVENNSLVKIIGGAFFGVGSLILLIALKLLLKR